VVSVFSAVLDSPFDKIGEVQEWKHETSHDSCWKDIQVFFQTYLGMAEEINKELIEEGYQKAAPSNMHQHNSFAMFGAPVFSWVGVHRCSSSYRRKVQVL